MTTLYGKLEENEYKTFLSLISNTVDSIKDHAEDPSVGYTIVYAIGALHDAIYQSIVSFLELKGNVITITGFKLIDDRLIFHKFTALDVIISMKSEGVLQATVTAVGASELTAKLGKFTLEFFKNPKYLKIKNIYAILIAYIFTAFLGYYISKYVDATYDWAEDDLIDWITDRLVDKYIDWKYNESANRLMLVTNLEDANEIATLIGQIMVNPEVAKFNDKIAVKQEVNGKDIIYTSEKIEKLDAIAEKYNTTREVLFKLNPWLKKRKIDDCFILINENEKLVLPAHNPETWHDAVKPVSKIWKKIPKIFNYDTPRKLPDLKISLKYNKNDVYDYFKPFLKSITYTDYIDNHCDMLELELFNDDYRFSKDWSLDKGAKLTCNVQYGNQLLKCGTFTIDKNESVFSTKENIVKVTAIAIPSDVPIRRKNSNTFEKMHIRDIAQFFADKYEFKFIANDEDKGIILERVDQVETSDMKFLSDLAYKYGYIFKLTDHTLTFLRLPEQNPIFELNKSNISRIEINDKTAQKAGYIEYYNPEKGELEYVQIGKTDNNIVQLQQRFHSRGEAQTILATEIKRTSKEKKGVLHLAYPMGNFNAGIDFTLKDFGKNDGVYRITKSIHSITGDFGWQVVGAFEECEEITYKLNKPQGYEYVKS